MSITFGHDPRIRDALSRPERRGEHENPDVDDIIYADTAWHAHTRRWANRQSARSATQPDTRAALIVVEAIHEDGQNAITTALNSITDALTKNGHRAPRQRVLSRNSPRSRGKNPGRTARSHP